MSAHDYDDTDMPPEEFDARMAAGIPADVTNLGGRTVGSLHPGLSTGSSNTSTFKDWPVD